MAAELNSTQGSSIRIGHRPRAFIYAGALSLLLCGLASSLQGADPYAAALDKRFEPASTPPQGVEPGVAAFEEGLKNQIREMSRRPEPVAAVTVEAGEPWLILSSMMGAALVLSLVVFLALRRWNQWLDAEAAKRLSALADDPLMAEFLRALKENPQTGSEPAQPAEPADAKSIRGPESGSQNPFPADPVRQATTLIRETV